MKKLKNQWRWRAKEEGLTISNITSKRSGMKINLVLMGHDADSVSTLGNMITLSVVKRSELIKAGNNGASILNYRSRLEIRDTAIYLCLCISMYLCIYVTVYLCIRISV